MFIDRSKLRVLAGKGGNGVVAWRREKYVAKGGPAGGDGGKGGSVIFQADEGLYSLDNLRHRRVLKAENGVQGGSALRKGRGGRDCVVKVPCGTLIHDEDTGELLCDLVEHEQTYTVVRGGKGGYGNAHFKSSVNRAPNTCTLGTPGEERFVSLELKLIADIGLVGFPNAGKSTLITKLANVRVKVAPYPFTTLTPNIGVMYTGDGGKVFIADIPGIIEGAHRNKGLGLEFLRHIERTRMLLFVLDASGIDGRDPLSDFEVLRKELSSYDQALFDRPFLVVLNKTDLEWSKEHIDTFRKAYPYPPETLLEISAQEGDGLDRLRSLIVQTAFDSNPDSHCSGM